MQEVKRDSQQRVTQPGETGELNRFVGVVHYGLGAIGMEIARLIAERPGFRSVGAVDMDPALVGHRLSEFVGSAGFDSVEVTAEPEGVLSLPDARVVVHSTSSSLEAVLPQLMTCIEAGVSVVSTCEQLSYPWASSPSMAKAIDDAARRNRVVVLGTGINPGFAMDYLPIVLSGACRRVDSVTVHRVQDAGVRRLNLQRKVGAGLSVTEFQERARKGAVRHVGLEESAFALASAFGWHLDELREDIQPVVARASLTSGIGLIRAGDVTGVSQSAIGYSGGREVVRLNLEIAVGLAAALDEVQLLGDPDVRMVVPGGLHGDVATAAVVVNAIERVLTATPGLQVMADLPPIRPVAPGQPRRGQRDSGGDMS
jgi:4-hydroxy-tetrahydrodipicolinate reductase